MQPKAAEAPADERALLDRAARGDEAALATLYEEHVDGLYAFVFYRVGRDPATAEDVVQDTFLWALDHAAAFEPLRGGFRAWLCTSSRNVIRKHLAARPGGAGAVAAWERVDRALADALANLDERPLSDEILAREQTRDLVNMTIANLPERYRTILERKYVAEESLAGIAAALALSEDAVKSLLARARRAFREAFVTLSRTLEESP